MLGIYRQTLWKSDHNMYNHHLHGVWSCKLFHVLFDLTRTCNQGRTEQACFLNTLIMHFAKEERKKYIAGKRSEGAQNKFKLYSVCKSSIESITRFVWEGGQTCEREELWNSISASNRDPRNDQSSSSSLSAIWVPWMQTQTESRAEVKGHPVWPFLFLMGCMGVFFLTTR